MSQLSTQKPAPSPGLQPPASSFLYAFWKFSRPHTIIGTSLSVLGLCLIAYAQHHIAFNWGETLQPALFLVGAWIACLCGNVYIVGLNQLEDIEIDQINKPHLPVAAGEFSVRLGKMIVAITGTLAILLALIQGFWLLATVGISLILGTAYSLPPIRLKRFPFWASFCIFTVRGVIVNLGLFLHFNSVFSRLETQQLSFPSFLPELSNFTVPVIPISVWALTLFILGFTFAIAIFKDIPDIEGDRQYNITTFTLKLGAPAVFNLALWVLTICYLGLTIAGFWIPETQPVFLALTHLTLLGLLWWQSRSVNLRVKSEIAQFYQFIWKLFFLEYLLFPAACLLT